MKKTLLFPITAMLVTFSTFAGNDPETKSVFEKKQPFMISSLKKTTSEDGVKGKIMISTGVGLNFFGTLLQARYIVSDFYYSAGTLAGHTASPMYNLMVDYGVGRKFSVGVATGYQVATVKFRDVIIHGDSYNDTWSRINIAVRGDYYIVAKEKANLYTGLKLGYNIYKMTSDIPKNYYPNYESNLGVTPQPVCIQAHFGFSYYFNEMIGFNTEIGFGVGSPYMLAAGLAIKI